MSLAPVAAAVTAALVGCGGSIAIVLAAAQSLQATPAETASWVSAMCFAIAASAAFLSLRHRLPLITAWSTPGAALIASSSAGIGLPKAIGAFIAAALLIVLASLITPLLRLIERIPTSVAAGMLAGVLLRLVMLPFEAIPEAPLLVLPLLALFLVIRRPVPTLAVIVLLLVGGPLAWWLGLTRPLPPLEFADPILLAPQFDAAIMLGLGVPLFLVTMASQNLAGFAVLKASGYTDIPSRSILATTGLLSLITAPFGAHTTNLAAISAAICTGPDAHKDPTRRWLTGPAYAVTYAIFAALGPSLVALFATLPSALIKTIAGAALAGPLIAALSSAFSQSGDKFAPGLAFVVTASGVTMFGVGAAFWGLLAGLLVAAIEKLTPQT